MRASRVASTTAVVGGEEPSPFGGLNVFPPTLLLADDAAGTDRSVVVVVGAVDDVVDDVVVDALVVDVVELGADVVVCASAVVVMAPDSRAPPIPNANSSARMPLPSSRPGDRVPNGGSRRLSPR